MSIARVAPVIALSALASLSACASPADDTAPTSSEDAVVASSAVTAADVESVIAELRAQRESAPLARYYEDGVRIEACWRNPAGSKLTKLKKALYCSMPLELRLCNTPVLLAIDENEAERRFRGYRDCKAKVDAVFGGTGAFAWNARVDTVYRHIYLEGATLSEEDTKRIVAANQPPASSRTFAALLLVVGKSLLDEARDLAIDALAHLTSDFEQETGLDPR
jgi:hypothetical protein